MDDDCLVLVVYFFVEVFLILLKQVPQDGNSEIGNEVVWVGVCEKVCFNAFLSVPEVNETEMSDGPDGS